LKAKTPSAMLSNRFISFMFRHNKNISLFQVTTWKKVGRVLVSYLLFLFFKINYGNRSSYLRPVFIYKSLIGKTMYSNSDKAKMAAKITNTFGTSLKGGCHVLGMVGLPVKHNHYLSGLLYTCL